MKGSADYGKDMRAVLDWTDPDMLREMLRLRLVSGMDGVESNVTFEKYGAISVYLIIAERTPLLILLSDPYAPKKRIKDFCP
jgi:hypothetical protein